MDAADALAWLYGLQPRGIRLELERMRDALALRGNPHRALRFVHVAGTNGKGSVCAMLDAALRASGLRVGLYTSPHLHEFGERIRVNGEPLDGPQLVRRLEDLRAVLEAPSTPQLTFFEVATLMAFEVFRDAGCDICVLEVGLGGRLDATNTIETALLTLITSVGIDHQAYLGHSLEGIAAEKAGILKAGVPCVTSAQGAALRTIRERAREVGAPLTVVATAVNDDAPATDAVHAADAVHVRVDGASVHVRLGEDAIAIESPLAGAHQLENTALVAAALLSLREKLPLAAPDVLADAVRQTRWPGRLEEVGASPLVIVDAAHNVDGAAALASEMSHRDERPVVLVFGAMSDKDWRLMLDLLGPQSTQRVYCAPAMARAERPEVLAAHLPGEIAGSVAEALALARQLAGRSGVVYAAGSIFVVAEVRAAALGIESGPPVPL